MAKKKDKLSFTQVWEKYVKPALIDSKCTAKHIQEMELHLSRWNTYWKKTGKPIRIDKCERKHLEEYRRYLMEMEKYKPRSINKHLGTIRSILVSAAKNGLLKRRPMLEQLPDSTLDPARKIYLRDEQIDTLMLNTGSLYWPSKSMTGVDPQDWWRCALVLYRTYGFRPQELLCYESKKTPVTWANISFEAESPNPSSEETNEHGWLYYVPPKTRKKKPHNLYLPLTRHARAALNMMLPTRTSPNAPIFPMPNSQAGFLKQWYEWFEDSGVKPKIPGERFKPYCLRKTCATHMSAHKTGLASAVCRWGSSGEANVASEHYIGSDNIIKFLLTAPMPASFDLLLG